MIDHGKCLSDDNLSADDNLPTVYVTLEAMVRVI